MSRVKSQVDTSSYILRLDKAVLPFIPGQTVKFEGADHLIRRVRIEGHACETTAMQEFEGAVQGDPLNLQLRSILALALMMAREG